MTADAGCMLNNAGSPAQTWMSQRAKAAVIESKGKCPTDLRIGATMVNAATGFLEGRLGGRITTSRT